MDIEKLQAKAAAVIHRRRVQSRLNRREFSDRIGCCRSSLSHIELGQFADIKLSVLVALAAEFGITAAALVEEIVSYEIPGKDA
ncbi:MAG TPA: helix-turn-helix transcriptional regulator [candidate division Zixibacteria bacterium]|nr:helix-turn-helix transcriptional regulator [candidate division Zixibacteria bacterium]